MASVIYPISPYGNIKSIQKMVCFRNNTKAKMPNGYIIAKGNTIEGITAEI